jgi:transposase
VAEQRYEAVRAVIADGETVTSVAARFGVSRKTLHVWLARYEAGGLEELKDRSHRPRSCPHQMPAPVEVVLAELRKAHPTWGPRRLSFELGKRGHLVSESAAYRAPARLSLIDPAARRPRDRKWKRWERGAPMELWQMGAISTGSSLAEALHRQRRERQTTMRQIRIRPPPSAPGRRADQTAWLRESRDPPPGQGLSNLASPFGATFARCLLGVQSP